MHPGITIAAIQELLRYTSPETILSESAKRKAAVALILRDGHPGAIEMLLIQRAEDPRDDWSGHMAFPGGQQEPCDRTLEEAARRETREEVGLALTRDMLLGRLDDLSAGRRQAMDMSVSPFVYHLPAPQELTLNHEVARAMWLPLPDLMSLKNIQPYQPSPAQNRICPSIHYDGCTIWGLTYQMLCSFARVLGMELIEEGEFSEP